MNKTQLKYLATSNEGDKSTSDLRAEKVSGMTKGELVDLIMLVIARQSD